MTADYHRMDRLQNAFTNLRTRTYSSADTLPQPSADEWYIPYTGNPTLPPQDPQRPQKKATHHRKTSSLGGNLRSAMCGAEMEDDGHDQRDVRYNPAAASAQRFLSRSHKGSSPSFSFPSSQESLNHNPAPATRFPSYTSVPTGLEEPNILFSPLNRELRAKAESSGESVPLRDQPTLEESSADIRRRTVSLPSRSHHNLETYQQKDEPRQWLVPSARELFLFPRPHLYPRPSQHAQTRVRRNSIESFSTSSSDNGARVLEKTQVRAKERNDWATLVQRRGRSLSLGGRAEPPPDAPIVGNAKARERERSRSRERGRNGSMLNISLGGVQGRKRSASLGSRWGRHSKNSSVSDRGERGDSVNNFGKENESPAIPKSFDFTRSTNTFRRGGMPPRSLGVSDPNLIGSYQRNNPTPSLAHSRGYTQSHPDLYNTLHSYQEPRNPAASVPLGRTLHFKQPSVADRGGVVVISRNASSRWASSRANRSVPFLETEKPLPSLPTEQRLSSAPSDMPVSPTVDSLMFGMSPAFRGSGEFEAAQDEWQRGQEEIGVAVSPGLGHDPEAEVERSQRPEDLRFSDGSSKARDFLAKQQKLARMRKAFKAPVQSPAGYRRPGPISPHVLSPLYASTTTNGDSSGAANDSSGLLPSAPSPVSSAKIQIRQPTIEERGHSRSTSVGVIEGQGKDPQALTAERPWSGSDLELKSKNGSRSSTAEQRTRSSGISTVQDEEDFHGLFFRTPHDAQSTPSLPSGNLFPPLPPLPPMSSRGSRLSFGVDTISRGNGQGLAHSTSDSQLRRTSAGSDGTMLEINTPDTMLEEILTQGLDVGPRPVTPPRRKLLAPISIERPIGEKERQDDSFERLLHQSQDHQSPSRPESGTMPPQNPTVMPSPVTFSLAPKQPIVSHSHHPFAHPHNFPSNQSLHTPLQSGRSRSRGDGLAKSPAMSWYRDSAAVSFVDDFPSPPGRYDVGEEEGEERIYSPAKRRTDSSSSSY
ncbi:hypothetical protein B9479_002667 [Cryptococcus floricola]|uniref:Uncharacterized protein n=1 Tax=Cryptococcus floricola TaxID=2591691 RepID=A0A5D3AYZ5_9TREE|nr:hypothetical protein B9479_002667 [Cryptococcus floricola]